MIQKTDLYTHPNLINHLDQIFPDPKNFDNLTELSHPALMYKLGKRQAFLYLKELYQNQENKTVSLHQPVSNNEILEQRNACLLYTSPSPRDS